MRLVNGRKRTANGEQQKEKPADAGGLAFYRTRFRFPVQVPVQDVHFFFAVSAFFSAARCKKMDLSVSSCRLIFW